MYEGAAKEPSKMITCSLVKFCFIHLRDPLYKLPGIWFILAGVRSKARRGNSQTPSQETRRYLWRMHNIAHSARTGTEFHFATVSCGHSHRFSHCLFSLRLEIDSGIARMGAFFEKQRTAGESHLRLHPPDNVPCRFQSEVLAVLTWSVKCNKYTKCSSAVNELRAFKNYVQSAVRNGRMHPDAHFGFGYFLGYKNGSSDNRSERPSSNSKLSLAYDVRWRRTLQK